MLDSEVSLIFEKQLSLGARGRPRPQTRRRHAVFSGSCLANFFRSSRPLRARTPALPVNQLINGLA